MGVVKDVIHAARSLKAQYELQVRTKQLHTQKSETAACGFWWLVARGHVVEQPLHHEGSRMSAPSRCCLTSVSLFVLCLDRLSRVPRCSRCW